MYVLLLFLRGLPHTKTMPLLLLFQLRLTHMWTQVTVTGVSDLGSEVVTLIAI